MSDNSQTETTQSDTPLTDNTVDESGTQYKIECPECGYQWIISYTETGKGRPRSCLECGWNS